MSNDVVDNAGAVHRRDAAMMIRWVFIVAIVVALVLVAMDNRDDVRVGYAVGDASAPIWTVIVISAVAGLIIGWLIRHRPHRRA